MGGRGGASWLPAGSTAFVGGDSALAAVTGALARGPAVVLVEGEAGIGKTRLVAEALTRPSRRRSSWWPSARRCGSR